MLPLSGGSGGGLGWTFGFSASWQQTTLSGAKGRREMRLASPRMNLLARSETNAAVRAVEDKRGCIADYNWLGDPSTRARFLGCAQQILVANQFNIIGDYK